MKIPRRVSPGEVGFDLEAVQTAAADWLARRERGLSVEEQQQFSEWLLADVRHAAAVKEIQEAWRFIGKPRLTGQADFVMQAVEQRVHRRSRRKHWSLALGSLAAAAALAIGVFVLREGGVSAPIELAGRVEIRPERRILPDGSVVELKTGADISFDFSPEQRGVRLVRGEAHFVVTKDPKRPFVVTAGKVTVRAVGTAFAVRVDPTVVDVLVTEGRVAVQQVAPAAPASAPAVDVAPTYLDAGNRAVVPVAAVAGEPLEVQSVAAGQIESALAWRSMRVEFTATPLTEIVTRLNRQNAAQLSLAEPALGELRISGIFWLDDPHGFARLIEASAGLRATSGDGRIVLSRL